MSLNTYALTTVARLKTFLGITAATDDTFLERIANAASDWVENYCDRRFKKTAYTNELYDGTGGATLLLRNYPVVAGQAFTLEQRAGTDNVSSFTTLDTNLYFVKNTQGIVEFASGKFYAYSQFYRLSYTAGYDFDNAAAGATLESVGLGDLEYAVWKLCATIFNDRKQSGRVQSENIGNYSVTFRREVSIDPEIAEILARFRRPPSA